MVTGFRTARGLPMEHRFTLRSGAFGRRGLAISGLTPPYLPLHCPDIGKEMS